MVVRIVLLMWLFCACMTTAMDIQRLLLKQQEQMKELEEKLDNALETLHNWDHVPDFANWLSSRLGASLGQQYGEYCRLELIVVRLTQGNNCKNEFCQNRTVS